MKHAVLLLLSILTFHFSLQAQTPELVKNTTEFIRQQKFDDAIRYLDSIIKTDSRNIDALMMKGNVILNRDLWNMPDPEVFTANDESIYLDGFEYSSERRKIVPTVTEVQVATLWLKCLAIDSSRLDIRKGLAVLYAMAVDLPKLKAAIADIKRIEPDNGEQAFNLNEYARKVKERGKFDEALEVYRYISTLYPHVAGVRADMASEYYYEGRINDALTWLDSTFNFKTVDETSFLNGAYLYSELGYFDNAQDVLNTYSKVYDRKMGNFYFGLRQFSDSLDDYYNTLSYFIQVVDSNAYYSEWLLAKQLLKYRTSFTLSDYKDVAGLTIPEAYKVLIHTRAVKQFADCDPYIRYGVQQNMARNFSAAVQFLEEGENCYLPAAQKERWQLDYGYALFMSGNYAKATTILKPLHVSKDFISSCAAEYFTAKALIKLGKVNEAKPYLMALADTAKENKYGILAGYQLNLFK